VPTNCHRRWAASSYTSAAHRARYRILNVRRSSRAENVQVALIPAEDPVGTVRTDRPFSVTSKSSISSAGQSTVYVMNENWPAKSQVRRSSSDRDPSGFTVASMKTVGNR
jgi:hypothetical protein